MLATCSFDASCAVWRERGGDWECAAVVEGHENEIKACAWSPSGTLLATCGRDKTVWIWEVQPGFDFECVAVLNGHTQDVKCVRWHPTEDVLVSTSYDDTIKVWEEDVNGDDWSCTLTLSEKENGHASTVWSAVFEPHGARRMATCSDDGKIVVWSATGAGGFFLSGRSSFLFRSGVFFSVVFRYHQNKQRWSDGRVERSNIRPGQHNCQRKRTVGLAAPAGKIATDASLTCGRVGSSPATLCVFFTSLSFLFCSRKERAKQSFR